jgi:type IV fimbrial biogenesis protein FimT
MTTRKHQAGHTLVEWLTTVGLLGTLTTVGVPTVTDLVHSSRVQAGSEALASSLALTRSEAVKRNARVVMCKSASGQACESLGTWEQGWIIFEDRNNNGRVDAGEEVMHREAGMANGLRMSGNTPVSQYVSYTPYGRTRQVSGAFQAGTFTVCSQKAAGRGSARQVVINSVGRPRVAKAADSVCA